MTGSLDWHSLSTLITAQLRSIIFLSTCSSLVCKLNPKTKIEGTTRHQNVRVAIGFLLPIALSWSWSLGIQMLIISIFFWMCAEQLFPSCLSIRWFVCLFFPLTHREKHFVLISRVPFHYLLWYDNQIAVWLQTISTRQQAIEWGGRDDRDVTVRSKKATANSSHCYQLKATRNR